MNAEIFRDSLERHSNVCHGCFKTIYTLGTNRAVELGAPLVVTGLSRGQLFETRLVPAQFRPSLRPRRHRRGGAVGPGGSTTGSTTP